MEHNSNNKTNEESVEKTDSLNALQDSQKKRQKKVTTIIAVVLLVIALGIGTIYYFYQKAVDYNKEQIELSEEERQAAIANLFSVSAYDQIPAEYKEHIYHFLDYNNYLDGTYFLTKIEDRAKNVFAFGDFTSDDNDYDDMAVLFESSDFKSSRLVIFNHKGELLFVQDYDNQLPTINSFKVGSKIYMDQTELVPAPTDGLIVKSPYNKQAVVYNKKNKNFDSYYQYTKEELEAMENEGDYEDSDYEIDAVEEVTNPSQKEEEFTIQEIN